MSVLMSTLLTLSVLEPCFLRVESRMCPLQGVVYLKVGEDQG